MLHVQLRGIPEGECWLASLFPLGNGSLGPLLQLHAQSLGPPHPCRPPMWAPRPYRPPSLSPSTMASGGQLVDVSQRKASTVLNLAKPLDGPLDLAFPDVALWTCLGTLFPLCRRSWSKPASLAVCRALCVCFMEPPCKGRQRARAWPRDLQAQSSLGIAQTSTPLFFWYLQGPNSLVPRASRFRVIPCLPSSGGVAERVGLLFTNCWVSWVSPLDIPASLSYRPPCAAPHGWTASVSAGCPVPCALFPRMPVSHNGIAMACAYSQQ